MVTADPAEAADAAARGEVVVLVLAPGAPARPALAGRVAVLVGEPADPAARRAATAMEAEVFARSEPPPAL